MLIFGGLLAAAGCHSAPQARPAPIPMAPRELNKAILPPYRLEPPDVLVINAIHLAPKPEYRLRTGDLLYVQVPVDFLPEIAPIDGQFAVGPGGMVNLGPFYGSVRIGGMTVEQAHAAIKAFLESRVRLEEGVQIVLTVVLSQMSGVQQIVGEHLLAPDGSVTLGSLGSVRLVGMTREEAKWALEDYLGQFFDEPEIAVDVLGYNSKVYYVVTQGAGLGDSIVSLPVTGNETVLDALSNVNGISGVSSKRVWIARPGMNSCGEHQILPVDYRSITAKGDFRTNYQLFPGDRLFIAEDQRVAFDTGLGKLTAPLERIMGFALLTVGTATRFSGQVLRGGGARNSTGAF